jgi:hypothetical protein
MSTPEPKKAWFEPACAILMAAASVATAWCSYQSSCWSDRSSELDGAAATLQRQATAQHLESRQIEAIQMRLVMEVIDARMEGNENLANFYADRFRDELKPAYEQWLALDPFSNPNAPPHPFVPDLYKPRFEQEVRDARAAAARAEDESSVSGQYARSYLSNTVSLATVLLFAATAEKFDQRRVRLGSLAFAFALFLFAGLRAAMLPILQS